MRITRTHASSLLLLALLLSMVAYPLASAFRQAWAQVALNSVFVLVLFAAAYAEPGGFSLRRPGVYATFAAILLRIVTVAIAGGIDDPGYRALLVVTEVFTALILFRFCWVILRNVTRRPRITADTIAGASAVYVLLAVAFAQLHSTIFILDHGAFGDVGIVSADGSLPTGRSLQNALGATFTYYSAVTQTTLGYGDITPKSPTARGLAILQTIVGQLYLAVLLARLVAMELSQRNRGGRE